MSEWSPVRISAWGHRSWRKSALKSKWKTEPLPLAHQALGATELRSKRDREVRLTQESLLKAMGFLELKVLRGQFIHCPPLMSQEGQ